MLSIHSSALTEEIAENHSLKCAIVDSASLMAAQLKQQTEYEGCPFPAVYAVAIQPAEDMVIPMFMCTIHFNGFKLGLREGIALSEELLEH